MAMANRVGLVNLLGLVETENFRERKCNYVLRCEKREVRGVRNVNRVNGRESAVLEAEKAKFLSNGLDWPGSTSTMLASKLGRFVEKQLVYRQTFVIRSYEVGPDKTASMETLMNLLQMNEQETALNHVMSSGLAGDGFGATQEMSIRKLIWVVTRINIQVDRYSAWGDVVEIDTWVDASGKNGMRRDWIIRDYHTQQILTRATSTWVVMNRETRRLSKLPEQVREEIRPYYLERFAFSTDDTEKINKLNDDTAKNIRSGLVPRWSDMDMNQHVNNVKYIGWIFESVPMKVLEDYTLAGMTLEYRRECLLSHVLDSLTTMEEEPSIPSELESTHLLRMQADKAEIIRARAYWRSKGLNT
ncbi:hypothetical protein AMTRI_Chr06g192880 [Amborella trichopoda]